MGWDSGAAYDPVALDSPECPSLASFELRFLRVIQGATSAATYVRGPVAKAQPARTPAGWECHEEGPPQWQPRPATVGADQRRPLLDMFYAELDLSRIRLDVCVLDRRGAVAAQVAPRKSPSEACKTGLAVKASGPTARAGPPRTKTSR